MADQSLVVKAVKNPNKVVKKIKRVVEHNFEDTVRTFAQRHIWSSVINQTEIRIVGLRRTGNHAIINWLREQATGVVWHLNNVAPLTNPFRYKCENLQDYFPQYEQAIARYRSQAKGDFVAKDWLLYSYEDYALEQITKSQFERKHDLYLGKSAIRYDLLILRDPFNLFASRLKNNYLTVSTPPKTLVEMWLDYAQEFVGETNYLTNHKICLNYNRWTIDVDYRQQIAEKLGLKFSDAGIDRVGSWGGGSSFEGQEFDGQATKMDILNRWKHFQADPKYLQLVNNRKLYDYSQRIFGSIPGTESLPL
ncbi:MAG: hypothetical protein SAL07_12640 [Oscillatoria sp. PMC 1051.18]|nr:hypothetical protein [Oscillatoria sp. PMC 1050.18]MEC5030737.1 hypothetical protein [Oscillatoria sp. PMC 1051.18]